MVEKTLEENSVVCPNCGYVHEGSADDFCEDGTYWCHSCDAEISVLRNVKVSYTTTLINPKEKESTFYGKPIRETLILYKEKQ